jgi:hypothetical protein
VVAGSVVFARAGAAVGDVFGRCVAEGVGEAAPGVAGFDVEVEGAELDARVAVGVGGESACATVPVGPEVAKRAPATVVASRLTKRRTGTISPPQELPTQ